MRQPFRVLLPVFARIVALASRAIPFRSLSLAGRSPHEACGVVYARRQLFPTETESLRALPASSHPVTGTLSAFPGIAKRFFRNAPKCRSHVAKYQHPVVSARSRCAVCHIVAGFGKHPITSCRCPSADLHGNPAVSFQMIRRLGGDHPIGFEPIRAAIQGLARVMSPDFALQIRQCSCERYIGRVCDDYMISAEILSKPVRFPAP